MPVLKWCAKCELELSTACFGPNKAHTDGLSTYCRVCERKRDKNRKKKVPKDVQDKANRSLRTRFNQGRHQARKRGLEWTLSFEEYVALITNARCHYDAAHELNPTGTGLDRIDNSRGYHIDNVVPCCRECNEQRHSMDHDLFHVQRARRYGKDALFCDLAMEGWTPTALVRGVSPSRLQPPTRKT
jgi:hypothetical protein